MQLFPAFGIPTTVAQFFELTWWLWFFAIFFPVWHSTWLFWRQCLFKEDLKWVTLELRIPREIKKSSKAMQQVLTSIHRLRNASTDFGEIYLEGEVTRWYSLELASFGGEVHFYIHVYHKQRALIEAAFFSYYPDIEIVEVDDYVSRFPHSTKEMYEQGYDCWGTELILSKEDAFPIRTYDKFEAPAEEKEYDPISTLIEVLAKAKPGEMVGIQILAAPASDKWRDDFEGLVDKLRERQGSKDAGGAQHGTGVTFEGGPLPALSVKTKEEQQNIFRAFMRTPGETDVLKEVEENLSYPAFEIEVRFVYFSPKSTFYDSYPRRGIIGSFNQYAVLDMNHFLENKNVSTRIKVWYWPYFFPNLRVEYRKERLIHNYRDRHVVVETFMGRLIGSYFMNWDFASRHFIMTTKCLATIYHPPSYLVLTAPHIERVPSRKAGAPAGLPIFGEEEEIERYQ